VKENSGTRRFLSRAAYLWLAGVIFLLFIAGYVLYSVLWVVRYFQTRKILLSAVLIVLMSICGTAYYLLFPLYGRHEQVTLVISSGTTAATIADTLYKKQIITSKKALKGWLRLTRIERRIQAGKFSFLTRSGVIAAVRELTKPVPLDKAVTIQEGLTIEQTAAVIAKTFTIDTSEFIRLCRDTAFLNKLGLGQEPSAEGYLFPDSYSFHENAAPAEIIRRMVDRFRDEWVKLDTAPAAGRNLTKREVVIVASIVEKEAMLGTERPRIAGVFYNRLRLGLPLGADPTVRYIYRKWDGPLYISELKSTSPYNTRLYKGLPPGPICSPGLRSLSAAVSPAQTNELYFVAKWDGSCGHDFSVTYQEHVQKTNSIRLNNKERIRKKEVP
jgi:UPF0755 protein